MIDTIHVELDQQVIHLTQYSNIINSLNLHENLMIGLDPKVHRGRLKNMRVKFLNDEISVEGSIPKEIYGNNVVIPSVDEIILLFEMIKGEYQLPLMLGNLTRIDIGYNFLMNHPVKNYLNCLQETPGYSFSRYKGNVYYQKDNYKLLFYDKGKQIRKELRRNPSLSLLPDEILNGNLLRYEISFTGRLNQIFDFGALKPVLLHSTSFRKKLFELWKRNYFEVNKSKALKIDSSVNTVPKLKNQIRLHGIEFFGGLTKAIEAIRDLYNANVISENQFYAMTKWLKGKSSESKSVSEVDYIQEINEKIEALPSF